MIVKVLNSLKKSIEQSLTFFIGCLLIMTTIKFATSTIDIIL